MRSKVRISDDLRLSGVAEGDGQTNRDASSVAPQPTNETVLHKESVRRCRVTIPVLFILNILLSSSFAHFPSIPFLFKEVYDAQKKRGGTSSL